MCAYREARPPYSPAVRGKGFALNLLKYCVCVYRNNNRRETGMNDFIWFIAASALFVLLGMVFSWLGLVIWKKRKTELIIRYHCDKVSEENKPAYCMLSGIGVFLIGLGFVLSGICAAFTQSVLVFIPMAAGLAAGIMLLVLAGTRYNH